ncbi:MAG TPA: hypothetical protein PKW50_07925, partial [Syntrophomonas sp.]|nr:hypothetical protein [Syntrophomonas sp.]
MFDSSSKNSNPNDKDNNLRSHKGKFNIYDQPNVEIFFNAYRNTDIIMSILNLEDFTYADINDSWVNAFGYSR